jgi:hypothetical protein
LTRKVGKNAMSSFRRTDVLWIQLEDLKHITFKETIKFTVAYIIIVITSATINIFFITLRNNKFMWYREKEEMTTVTGISAPPYIFVVWYLTKAISYLVPCIYVTQKIIPPKGEKQNTNSNCFISSQNMYFNTINTFLNISPNGLKNIILLM